MRLVGLRYEHPGLFLMSQDWFLGEEFFVRDDPPLLSSPKYVARCGGIPHADALPSAVQLADDYVRNPTNPVYQNYLWTCDSDRYGQRVYVGGVKNRGVFEIHRHLEINDRWGIPCW